jgi:membrane protease subunit (stomatin/prohibitin family)
MGFQQVLSTLDNEGRNVMGPDVLVFHYPGNNIVSGSLLTVESNQLCVLKSRGAILNVYGMGQYQITTGDKPLVGSIAQGFFGGTSPWQYEAIYVNSAKLVGASRGTATSAEMAEMSYEVDYYLHCVDKEGALKLIQHMPYAGHMLRMDALDKYVKPVIEQAINKIVQVTPLERINEKIQEIRNEVHGELKEFLDEYGITLDNCRVVLAPADERMRTIISLKALNISEEQAVRYYIAMLMAERGVVSAPNMANGTSFTIGGSSITDVPLGVN